MAIVQWFLASTMTTVTTLSSSHCTSSGHCTVSVQYTITTVQWLLYNVQDWGNELLSVFILH